MKNSAQTLKLSDAFEDDGDGGKVNLELELTVININEGFNQKIVEKCPLLRDYVRYIDIVETEQKRIAKENPVMTMVQAREKAIVDSISYCKKRNILKDFFEKLSPEELNMLTAEWNLEDAIKIAREESWEKARHEAAINALKEGLSVEQTARITGIPTDELKQMFETTFTRQS
jgi:hypothetical protein